MANFDYAGAKAAGASDSQIADYLADRDGFDIAGARAAGADDGQIIGHLTKGAGERSWKDAAKDTLAQVAEGAVNLVKAPVDLVAPDSGAAAILENSRKFWYDAQSPAMQDKLKAADAKVKAAGADGLWEEVKTAAAEYATDPALAARFATTNVASVVPGLALGKAAQAAALTKGASAARAAAVATGVSGGTNAVLNAGGARGEAFDSIRQAYIDSGLSEPEASELALNESLAPAAVGAATGFLSGKIGAEKALLGAPVSGGLGRKAALKASAKTIGAELLGEQIEELTPQLTTNLRLSDIDGRAATQGLGATAVQTALGSGPIASLGGAKSYLDATTTTPTSPPRITPEQQIAAITDQTTSIDQAIATAKAATELDATGATHAEAVMKNLADYQVQSEIAAEAVANSQPTASGLVTDSSLPLVGQPAPAVEVQPIVTGQEAPAVESQRIVSLEPGLTPYQEQLKALTTPVSQRTPFQLAILRYPANAPEVALLVEQQNSKTNVEPNNGIANPVDLAKPAPIEQQILADNEEERYSTDRSPKSAQLFTEDAPVFADETTAPATEPPQPTPQGSPNVATTAQAEQSKQEASPAKGNVANQHFTGTGAESPHIANLLGVGGGVKVHEVTDISSLPSATQAVESHTNGAPSRMSRHTAVAIQRLMSMLGRKVQFYEASQGTHEGVTHDGKTIYVNVDGGVDAMAVAGHEFTHTLKHTDPEAYGQAHAAVMELLKNNPERSAGYAKYLNNAKISVENPAELAHELLADIGGNEARTGEFWGDVFDQIHRDHPPTSARAIVLRLRDALVKFINKLIIATPKSGFEHGFKREELTAVRELLVRVAHQAFIRNDRARLGLPPLSRDQGRGDVRYSPENATLLPTPSKQKSATETDEIRPTGAVLQESAVYTVNEPDAITGDVLMGAENVLPDRQGKNQRHQAGTEEQIGSRVLAIRPSSETPGIYLTTTQIVTVGERSLPVDSVKTSEDAARVFASLARFAVEHVEGLVTDEYGKPLAIIGSFKGASSEASVHPSTMMAELSRIGGAANLWISHNHPSGKPDLSSADERLSRLFRTILDGSGVEYRGLSAMARKGDEVQWTNDQYDSGAVAFKQEGSYKILIVDRIIVDDEKGEKVGSPSDAKRIVRGMAGGMPGIVFLTTQNDVSAFVPFDPDEMGLLRQGDRLMRLFGAASKSGASGAIVAMPDEKVSTKQYENVAGALSTIDIRVLDGIRYDSTQPGGEKSLAESGEGDSRVGASFESRATPSHQIHPAMLQPIRDIQDIVDRFKSHFKGVSALNIRVVSTVDDIPARFRPSPYAEGVFHDDVGLIYLVADNMLMKGGQANTARALQVLAHETVGHYGLAQMMGSRFNGVLRAVMRVARDASVQDDVYGPGDPQYATVEAVRLRYPDASEIDVAQEVLARMAETDPGSSKLNYIRAIVRQWLRDVARAVGVGVQVTNDELNDLVALASAYMRSGKNLEREADTSGLVAASKKASDSSEHSGDSGNHHAETTNNALPLDVGRKASTLRGTAREYGRTGNSTTDFVTVDGSEDLGEITPSMAKAMRRQPGSIRLENGNARYGLAHIEERRGEFIRALGFDSVEGFVLDAVENISAVWSPATTAQLVVIQAEGKGKAVFIELKPSENGDYYTVKTAFPISDSYADNKKDWKLLWSGASVPTVASGANPLAVSPPNAGAATTMTPGQSSDPNVSPEVIGRKYSTPRLSEELEPKLRDHFKSEHPQIIRISDNTPASLQLFGWSDMPVVIQPDVIDKMHFDHGMTIPQMAKLPFLLQRPMMIFGDAKNNSLVFIGEQLKPGKPVLVAVKQAKGSSTTGRQYTAMIVTGYNPQNGWDEVAKRLMRGELVYRDTEQEGPSSLKSFVSAAQKKYAQSSGRLLPRELLQGRGASVLERAYNVLGHSDLVKLENAIWPDGVKFSPPRIIGDSGRKYTPEQQALHTQTGREINPQTTLDRLKKWADQRWAQVWFDQFEPIKDLDATAYRLTRQSKGATGAFEAFLNHGKLSIEDGTYNADITGGVIDVVFRPIGKETTDFLYWVAGNRAERLAAEGKERLFSPANIAAAKTLADGITDFDYILPNGQATRDRTLIYRDTLRKFNAFNKNVMDMAEQSGLIDGASRHLWEHEFYVPFYRVTDDKDGSVRGMNIKKGIVRQTAFKKLKGGTDGLNDLLSNTLMNWAHLIDAAAKNRAAKATLDIAENLGAAQRVASSMAEYVAANGALLHPDTKNTVWYTYKGEPVKFVVEDKALLTAIGSLDYVGLRGPMMSILTAPKYWLTMGVTASPFFKVRNLIRDSVQAIGTSELGYNVFSNLKQGWELTHHERPEYVSALAGGGLIRFGTMLEGNEAKRTRRLIAKGATAEHILDSDSKLRAFWGRFAAPTVDAYNEIGNRGEEINRMALYNQLRKKGVSHGEAAFQARDLMDFSMQGSGEAVRILIQVVPFMNARLQGMYKLGKSVKKEPAKFAWVLGAVTLASLSLLAIYHDDDDWKKREDWDRDNYWWFKVGNTAFRIPKPFEIGAIATLAERSAELMFNDEMNGARYRKVVGELLLNQLSMNPIPQMAKPIIDLYANKDSFSGRPIESMGMEKLDPEYRFTSNTSMPARGLSTAIGGALSPVQIDHLVRGYFSWFGAFTIGAADMAARAASDEPTKPTMDYWKFATGGMVSSLDGASSRYVSQMYEQAKELEAAHGTYQMLRKTGKLDEAEEYRDGNLEKLQKYTAVEEVKGNVAKLSARIRLIERSAMDPDLKREKILEIQKLKDQQARRVNF